jgi:HTH-type transcriptional regulator/antitoxin HigA
MFGEPDVLLWTENDHAQAVAEAESLFWAEPGTPENHRLHVLVSLIEAYEEIHIPSNEPSAAATAAYERDKHSDSTRLPSVLPA